ncbi:apolipoprotein acyltransferase [Rubripirellula sp.]|nr:apolipoprotein acyltransferase [Rubripirellula sp.]MDB4339148.1 apolipoprotein acyltransferase [Rubripirellula sp.]
MNSDDLISRCLQLTNNDETQPVTPESLIGFFQCFRPDGKAIEEIFTELDQGNDLLERLEELYYSAGDDRRPSGGRDAYFVVRRPKPIEPAQTEQLGLSWLNGIRQLAVKLDQTEIANSLREFPEIRILEGLPPKHPKAESEQPNLLRSILAAGEMTATISAGPVAESLRQAYYFIACDPMLRDYLMWPFYRSSTQLNDPFASYFQLWQHGVKYRIFGETQVDFYLPRQRAA